MWGMSKSIALATFHDLVHGLTRQGIDQIDGNIIKTSLLGGGGYCHRYPVLVTPSDLFQHLVIKGLDTQRGPRLT